MAILWKTPMIISPIQYRKYFSFPTAPTAVLIGTAFMVGIGGGLGAVLFRWLIRLFTHIFFERIPIFLAFIGDYSIILVPAIGALFFSPLIYFFAREAKGHGVPEVMEAIELKGGRIRPVVGVIKSLASSLCIGSGGSVGREGPIVQIGSAIGSTIGRLLHFSDERIKNLVASGAASGIAATFNAPIGGVFFALEVIMRDFSTKRLGAVVIASVTASVIGRIFLGNKPSIAVPPYTLNTPVELLFYLGFGLLLVPFCVLFIQFIYKSEDLFNKLHVHELNKPILGGLLLGGIGFFYPQVFGVGYENIDNAVYNTLPVQLMLLLIPLKIIAVSLTLGSGGSGGIFAPSLVLGALIGGGLGNFLAYIFPHLGIEPGAYAIVGMGAFFAGAAQAPITAILILFELTGDYLIILPLMLAVTITTLAVEKLHPESIYTLKLVRRGINLRQEMRRDILENIQVKEIHMKDIPSLQPSATIDTILIAFEKGVHGAIPVIEKDGTFHGLISTNEILTSLIYKDSLKNLVVAEDLARLGTFVEENDNLNDALKKFIEAENDVLPVIKREGGKTKLVGIISRHALLKAYSREVSVRQDE
ncbi:MAG: chloride channel protein [bacterium]